MTRLLVLVSPPRHLDVGETEGWLRRELGSLIGVAGARSASLSRAATAAPHDSGDWGWLVELEFESAEQARAAVRARAWSVLLGDLRLLGIQSTVALVGGAEKLTL